MPPSNTHAYIIRLAPQYILPLPVGQYASPSRQRHWLEVPPPRRHWPAALGQPPWGTGNAPSALSASPKTPLSMRLIAPLELYRSISAPFPVGQICVIPAKGTGWRDCRPAEAPAGVTAAPKALAGGAAANCHGEPAMHLPSCPHPKNAAGGKPLLLGLPPSIRLIAPLEVHRSISAPCPWGRYASTPRRRHWLAALPPTAMGNRHVPSPLSAPTKTH